MPTFIPGLELCGLFFREAVQPVLDAEFSGLHYDAALTGPGSEVLGYDTAESTDHNWGPRVSLFLSEADHPRYAAAIIETLRHWLPYTFRGYTTSYASAVEAETSMMPDTINAGLVNHRVEVFTVRDLLTRYLGRDPFAEWTVTDWLTTPEQLLLTVTAGQVYHSGLGELDTVRRKRAYYPQDVWLYLLACQWMRISQEEPFMGRTAVVGDDLGSRILAARLARDVMRLCFLMERRYAPYAKWFGTAFAQLGAGPRLIPILQQAIQGRDWKAREQHLSIAYQIVAEMHNALRITEPLPIQPTAFWERPYLVIHGERFSEAIFTRITDEAVRRLPRFVGSIDQYVDSTDVLSSGARSARLTALYREAG
ncbi:MAG: DUF4037 domain-containing protein [Anaerolineae bacterium]|nr:DUF4037 domain-containing protein [Anaerolineae bacterium]